MLAPCPQASDPIDTKSMVLKHLLKAFAADPANGETRFTF
jgi:hypothetical protein